MNKYILDEVYEGMAKILIIRSLANNISLTSYKPILKPVFYNPFMRYSRTIDTFLLKIFSTELKNGLICDLLSATGIRGIRYYLESNIDRVKVIFNDANPVAYNLVKKNILRNKIKRCEVYNFHANFLLIFYKYIRRKRFSVIDIDPFGSPIKFIGLALGSINNRGLIFVTSTDLAVLMGVYPQKCSRKYMAISFKSDFSREIALRILLGYIAREAAKHDIIIQPLLSYSIKHFIRICIRIMYDGSNVSKFLAKNIGYITYCNKCGFRKYREKIDIFFCPLCGQKILWGGPLWIGNIGNKDIVRKITNYVKDVQYISEKEKDFLSNMLEKMYFDQESIEPYYTTDGLSSLYKINEPSLDKLIYNLREKGYIAAKTHFSPKGFKTNAAIDFIIKLFN